MISVEALQSVLAAGRSNSDTYDNIMPANSNSSPSDGAASAKEAAANLNRVTIPLACTTCRSRHLKCDGKSPCSRCKVDNVECQYVKSRRGYKGPRRAMTGSTDDGKALNGT